MAVGGLLVGGVLVGTQTASAADTNSIANQNGAYGAANQNRAFGGPGGQRPGGNVDESKSQRPDEELLTGDTASKVKEAALAKYPGATRLRVETDSDGIYEAHLTTTEGQRVIVEDFRCTSVSVGTRLDRRSIQGEQARPDQLVQFDAEHPACDRKVASSDRRRAPQLQLTARMRVR